MYVEHSGWNNERGFFCDKIYFNENKLDFTIEFNNGTVLKQTSAFMEHTADWNCDGDIYSMYGAWFHEVDSKGNYSMGEFWTPEQMVTAVIEAQDPDRPKYGNYVKSISGICIPSNNKSLSLDEQIKQSERRALNQEAEHNRKMDSLSTRSPNDPWAR